MVRGYWQILTEMRGDSQVIFKPSNPPTPFSKGGYDKPARVGSNLRYWILFEEGGDEDNKMQKSAS